MSKNYTTHDGLNSHPLLGNDNSRWTISCTRHIKFKIGICCLLHIGECQIRHKLVRPYTPRHNGKVERSHREDQKRFYSCHAFYSLDDFAKQLSVHNRRPNNLPMRPLRRLSPIEFAVQYV